MSSPDAGASGQPLLSKLTEREWRVRIPCLGAPRAAALKELVCNGVVPVLFPDTLGGTELDVMLDACETSLDGADLDAAAGSARLAGALVLDDVPVRVVIEVAVDTLEGWARVSGQGTFAAPGGAQAGRPAESAQSKGAVDV